MSESPTGDAERSGTVAARLKEIRERIAAACSRVDRPAGGVVLIGASKRQPVARIEEACAAGLRDLGENRVQEASAKRPLLPSGLQWHLIGPLQSNKARLAAELFDVVHSVDRSKIARALDREAGRIERALPCFLEVNLGAEPSKHGFAPADLPTALDEILRLEHLEPVGLMAIPPHSDEVEGSRPWFRALRELRDRSRERHPEFPGLLSMGMSGDFEVAIEEGATHVRVGTALFGPRPD